MQTWKRFQVTKHAAKVMKEKAFDPYTILRTLRNPTEVYKSGMYSGQYRITGNGICIVGKPEYDEHGEIFTIITMYQDRVITDLRPDQIAAGVVIRRNA